MCIVINFLGEPSSGKSTASAYVYSQLKMKGVNCEYITEYAKDKLYDEALEPFKHQEYIFGKQSYRMGRVKEKVDVIITDSPLVLSSIYNSSKDVLGKSFDEVVLNMFNSYYNINYLLLREHKYEENGRFQNEEQSKKVRNEIEQYLNNNNIQYTLIHSKQSNYDIIVNSIIKELKSNEQ